LKNSDIKVQEQLLTEYKGRLLEAKNLPALPAALAEVNRLLKDPNSSSEQVAQVIERDQSLAAKVLRMVNSPIYGFPGRISNIKHTMVLLGMNVVRSIIVSSAVFDAMNKTMLGLWEHSVAASLAAVEIARATNLPRPEEYSVMGLLHDIGKVVFTMQIPEAKRGVDKLIKDEDLFSIEGEKRLLGFGHDRINAWVCEHWNLPLDLKEAMIYHHMPSLAQFHPEAAAVAHLADFMARLFECGSGGDDNVPPLDVKGLRLLKINQHLLESVLDKVIGLYSDRANLSVL